MIAEVCLSMEPDSPGEQTQVDATPPLAAMPAPPPPLTIKKDDSWPERANPTSAAVSSSDPTQDLLTNMANEFHKWLKPTTAPASDEQHYDYSYSSGEEDNDAQKAEPARPPPTTMFPPPKMTSPPRVKVEQPDGEMPDAVPEFSTSTEAANAPRAKFVPRASPKPVIVSAK